METAKHILQLFIAGIVLFFAFLIAAFVVVPGIMIVMPPALIYFKYFDRQWFPDEASQ
jgi:hypothetical protein